MGPSSPGQVSSNPVFGCQRFSYPRPDNIMSPSPGAPSKSARFTRFAHSTERRRRRLHLFRSRNTSTEGRDTETAAKTRPGTAAQMARDGWSRADRAARADMNGRHRWKEGCWCWRLPRASNRERRDRGPVCGRGRLQRQGERLGHEGRGRDGRRTIRQVGDMRMGEGHRPRTRETKADGYFFGPTKMQTTFGMAL